MQGVPREYMWGEMEEVDDGIEYDCQATVVSVVL